MAYQGKYRYERVREIQEFARQWYEPGRQDRSWRWVWEYKVKPKYHISYSTFKKYMNHEL